MTTPIEEVAGLLGLDPETATTVDIGEAIHALQNKAVDLEQELSTARGDHSRSKRAGTTAAKRIEALEKELLAVKQEYLEFHQLVEQDMQHAHEARDYAVREATVSQVVAQEFMTVAVDAVRARVRAELEAHLARGNGHLGVGVGGAGHTGGHSHVGAQLLAGGPPVVAQPPAPSDV